MYFFEMYTIRKFGINHEINFFNEILMFLMIFLNNALIMFFFLSPSLHLFDKKYRKSSDIVQYYYY